jgi:protein-tyrosine phosphatase
MTLPDQTAPFTPHAASGAAQRLEGAPNFRCVGSLQTGDGQIVRGNRLFRSDALHKLTDADLPRLAALGVGAVVDLRNNTERRMAPNRLPDAPVAARPQVHVFDAAPELQAVQGGGWRDVIEQSDFGPAQARAWMAQTYARMPAALAPAVRAAASSLAGLQGAPVPVIVHCMAGKDRTGFVCAMLLDALDVPRDAIMADYLLSLDRRPPERHAQMLLDWHGLPSDARSVAAMQQIATVLPEYLQTALATVDDTWGSAGTYLEQACDIDAAALQALRRQMLA